MKTSVRIKNKDYSRHSDYRADWKNYTIISQWSAFGEKRTGKLTERCGMMINVRSWGNMVYAPDRRSRRNHADSPAISPRASCSAFCSWTSCRFDRSAPRSPLTRRDPCSCPQLEHYLSYYFLNLQHWERPASSWSGRSACRCTARQLNLSVLGGLSCPSDCESTRSKRCPNDSRWEAGIFLLICFQSPSVVWMTSFWTISPWVGGGLQEEWL